ncbi:hypothetical protein Q3G72_012493 [Acer saccharum]|nr:hypothetical protein Q3G72_012493 [Acer saccharum]
MVAVKVVDEGARDEILELSKDVEDLMPDWKAAAALGYEDSKELFSMGRIDSEWLNRSSTKAGNRTSEFDEESEADLFEIVLDNSGRSPNRVL